MKLSSTLSIYLFFLLLATSCSSLPTQYYDNGVSDETYIHITSSTEEAQAFLENFPGADITVDRSGRLAVDYQFTKVQPATTEQRWEGIRLRIFINPKSKQVEDTFIQCNDQTEKPHFVEEELIRYLEQYMESHGCP